MLQKVLLFIDMIGEGAALRLMMCLLAMERAAKIIISTEEAFALRPAHFLGRILSRYVGKG